MMTPTLQPALAKLTPAEKLKLVGDLWNDIAESGVDLPLTAEQQAELRSEQEAIRRDGGDGSSWEEIRKRITGKAS